MTVTMSARSPPSDQSFMSAEWATGQTEHCLTPLARRMRLTQVLCADAGGKRTACCRPGT